MPTDVFSSDSANADLPAVAVESVEALAEVVRDTRVTNTPLRVAGAGTWMDAGRAVQAGRLVSLRALTGILEYVPGDLTITALAGTSHAELDAITAGEGQWIPLDPIGGTIGTIGATIATGSAGPLAATSGMPRDVILGIDAVLGQGDAIKAGGRVVKNVAGFDLVRLLTGSWGTLGIITAVSLRLRARPQMDETVAVRIPDSATELAGFLQQITSLPLEMSACELVSPVLATRLGVGDDSAMLMRFMGSEASVTAQLTAVSAALPGAMNCSREAWNRLGEGDAQSTAAIRWSVARANLPALWHAARNAEASIGGAASHATVARGVVRQVAPVGNEEALLAAWSSVSRSGADTHSSGFASGTSAQVTTVGERMPQPLWSVLCPTSVNDRLSSGIRDAFDPDRLLNRGILGEALPVANTMTHGGGSDA